MRSTARCLLALLCLAMAGACADPYPTDGVRTQCTSWQQEIGPLFASRCATCHSGPAPQGGYDASGYLAAIGGVDGPAWAVAGDPESKLLAALSPGNGIPAHQQVGDVLPQVTTWVVDCDLSYVRSEFHQGGILNPADSSQFHGVLLRGTGWDFKSCTLCHGDDFSGGKSGVSCLTCHPAGPTTCDTCHGRMDPAHTAHAQGRTDPSQAPRPIDCGECHKKPADYRDPGHLYQADGSPVTDPVTVQFGALAAATPPSASRMGPPTWLADVRACENVYCHGAVFTDTQAKNVQPAWAPDPSQAACGTCHGLPPSSHGPGQQRCVRCHNRTVDAGGALLPAGPAGPGLHLNGRADIGDGSGTCTACHGGPTGPAPPRDVAGNTDVSALGVGTHQSHMQALHRLRGPLACNDCHLVPAKVDSPGHNDADKTAPVFPPNTSALAQADGATPSWDHAAGRCTNVYCHGAGTKLGMDTTPGLVRAPVWTQPGQAACGTCHGIPPRDAAHTPGMRLLDCVKCHPSTIDATGALIVSGPPGAETSTHINGVVDVR